MIEIDGSQGEGGGQVLRTSLTLSALTSEPVRISNIRENRPRPGLANQHLTVLKAIGEVSQGAFTGDNVGSMEVVFKPGEVKGGRYRFDIGTAGSISLVLQSLIPILAMANEPSNVVVTGGTDVKWSPPIDYVRNVHLPLLKEIGVDAGIEIVQRGFYPKGGGEVVLTVEPTPGITPLSPTERRRVDKIRGKAFCWNLPEHIIGRMANEVRKGFVPAGIDVDITKEHVIERGGTGCGIVLWTDGIGSNSLGEPKIRAEDVGNVALEGMMSELKQKDGGLWTKASVDIHTADQLIVYLGVAGGGITCREMTSHTRTNIAVAEKMLGGRFVVEETDGNWTIRGP